MNLNFRLPQVQWDRNNGRCGVCGDPWDGTREHEAGGKFANGIITWIYEQESIMKVVVLITASHKGNNVTFSFNVFEDFLYL